MTRDEIAALLDGAKELRAFLDGKGSLLGYSFGDQIAGRAFWWRGHLQPLDGVHDIAEAAIAAMDRETALVARVAELEVQLAALRAQAHMATPDEGMVVAEDGAMMPEDVAAKVREHG